MEYFTERAPDLDHTSLCHIANNLCRLFWRDLEIHHPGIDSLRLEPAVVQAWKEPPGKRSRIPVANAPPPRWL